MLPYALPGFRIFRAPMIMIQLPAGQILMSIWTLTLGSALACGGATKSTVSAPDTTPVVTRTWVQVWSASLTDPRAREWTIPWSDLGGGCT